MEETNLNNVLFPKPKGATHTRRRRRKRRGPVIQQRPRSLLLWCAMVLVVLGIIFSVANIGGNIILALAQNYITENLNLTLEAQSMTGNPVKGYKLNNFSLSTASGDKLLDASCLSGRVSFPALLTGKVRLAELSLSGLSMDIDSLIATLQTLNVPVSSVKTYTPPASLIASPAYAELTRKD